MNYNYQEMSDTNIVSITPMPNPGQLKKEFPLDKEIFDSVVGPSRQIFRDILTGEDKRVLAVVGPCSIHNVAEAIEYAKLLRQLSSELKNIHVIMRACFDKPRTGRGWAGFFQDPDLNESRNIEKGWRLGRQALVEIVSMGMPVGMEMLDADAIQNIDDLVSYWWAGARTVTSQRLREITSGVSTPVGFKNPTDGRVEDAIEAINTAWHNCAFIATNSKGQRCEYRTSGNKYGHLILRGSSNGPNHDNQSVEEAVHKLAQKALPTRLLVDVSHANSGKNHLVQREIITDLVKRITAGENSIVGFLYESYLEAGNQKLPKDLSELKPRISITDSCDDFATTCEVLLQADEILNHRQK